MKFFIHLKCHIVFQKDENMNIGCNLLSYEMLISHQHHQFIKGSNVSRKGFKLKTMRSN
jgi:hypothetical protein